MPAQFFNIPLPQQGGLVELQAFLKKELPAADFQDPANFHITLVHVENPGEVDLSTVDVPFVPIFGVGGDFIRVFKTQDHANRHSYAVTLAINPVPQLVHLQALLFNQCRAMGLEVSSYSYPGLYKPHVTLARAMTEPPFLDLPTMVHLQADRFVLTSEGVNQDGSYKEVVSFPLAQSTVLGEAISEMATLRDNVILSEFSGSYPTVKIFEDVDIAALTAGDDDPDGGFVTLKIAKDNSTSDKNMFYSSEWVKELQKWVHEMRPIGIQGHLSDEERSTKFPNPNVYWVGTAKVGDTLWGKAYVPIGETRDMIRRTRAIRGKIATSIYGKGHMTWDANHKRWNMLPNLSLLEQIDLAPATRVGIPELAVVPILSKELKEMADNAPPQLEDESPMDKMQVIQEMTAADVKFLPEAVVNAITTPAVEAVQTQIAEIAKSLKVEPEAIKEKVKTLLEMEVKFAKAEEDRIKTLITSTVAEMVAPDAKTLTDGILDAREMVVELVTAREPKDDDAVKATVKEVTESESVQRRIKVLTTSEMGGNLRRQTKPTEGATRGNKFLKKTPAELRKQQAS